jgi:hypothetical protein
LVAAQLQEEDQAQTQLVWNRRRFCGLGGVCDGSAIGLDLRQSHEARFGEAEERGFRSGNVHHLLRGWSGRRWQQGHDSEVQQRIATINQYIESQQKK